MQGTIRSFWKNVGEFPRTFWGSMQRRGRAVSDRTRSIAVFSNLFLHIHSVKLHRHSLKPGYTLGLGLLTTAFLVLLTVTGADGAQAKDETRVRIAFFDLGDTADVYAHGSGEF